MNFISLIPYISLLYIGLITIHLGNVSSSQIPKITNIWYQDFFSSSQTSRKKNISQFAQSKTPYYHYQNTLTYLSDSGILTHIIRGERNIYFSPSKKFYLTYSKTGSNVNFYESTGTKKWGLQQQGTAHISPQGSIIMIVSTDNSSITLYNQAREIILPQTYLGSFITDFSFSPYNDSLVIATIEGKAYYYRYLNEALTSWEAPSSQYTYIKSIEISKTGQHVATLSGLKPERLTLYNIVNKESSQTITDSELTTELEEQWSVETQLAQRKKNSMFIDEPNQQLIELRNHTLHLSSLPNGQPLHQEALILHNPTVLPSYALIDSIPGFYGIATQEGSLTVLRVFSTAQHNLIWTHTYNKAIPLNIEFIPAQDHFVIVLTTHTGIYRYHSSTPL